MQSSKPLGSVDQRVLGSYAVGLSSSALHTCILRVRHRSSLFGGVLRGL